MHDGKWTKDSQAVPPEHARVPQLAQLVRASASSLLLNLMTGCCAASLGAAAAMRLLKERADKANARTTASVRELARVKDQLQVGQAAQAGLQHDMAAINEEGAKLDLTSFFRQPSACVLHHLQQQKSAASQCKQALRQH